MAIQSKDLTYVVGGVDMRSCYYVDPTAKGKRPGILVYPDASGLDHVAHAGARRLAEEGYAALACDLYGAGRVINDQPQAVEFAKKLVGDLTALAANGEAAFAALGSQAEVDPSKIAGMGYCLGGNVVVELARSGVPLAAIIGFHGGAVRPALERSRNIKGKVLLCLGANDPMIPLAMRSAFEEDMRAADVDWRMHIYGRAYHSFTNPRAADFNRPDAMRYDKDAEQRSWLEMKALLAEVFG